MIVAKDEIKVSCMRSDIISFNCSELQHQLGVSKVMAVALEEGRIFLHTFHKKDLP